MKAFRETLADFEASLGKQLHEGVAQRVKALRAVLAMRSLQLR